MLRNSLELYRQFKMRIHVINLHPIMKRDILLLPILRNSKYFVFMYILGAICIFTTGNKTYIPYYLKLYAELFLDLYISCCLLTLVNTKARKCIIVILYILLYLTAIVDIFCFIRISNNYLCIIICLSHKYSPIFNMNIV